MMLQRHTALCGAIVLLLQTIQPANGQTLVGPQCVGDGNGDSMVTVDEVVASVDNVLNGCAFEEVTIQFQAKVGDETFACGSVYDNIGLSNEQIIPADFRLYLHNLRFTDDQGREVPLGLVQDGIWQLEDLVLLDFEDKTPPCTIGTVQTNMRVRAIVPPGNYTGLRFSLGVPFRMNHQDVSTAASPLTLTAMFWSWQGGYKFLRIDEALDIVRVHLGSTGCVSISPTQVSHCEYPNVGEVFLRDFDASTDVIVVDLKTLLADSDLSINQPETPPGCMSGADDNDCAPMMQNLGVNFDNGLPDASRQTFFRIERPESE